MLKKVHKEEFTLDGSFLLLNWLFKDGIAYFVLSVFVYDKSVQGFHLC